MRVIALLCLCLLAPNAEAASGCDDLRGFPINQNVQWSQVWTALDQAAGCGSNCHDSNSQSGDLDLSSPTISIYFLVAQASSQNPAVPRVEPGNPRASLLLQKIGCAQPDVGGPMPPGSTRLPPAVQGLMYDWIEQGAYGENPNDPIARDFVFRAGMESIRIY
jgi:hypothetical protein